MSENSSSLVPQGTEAISLTPGGKLRIGGSVAAFGGKLFALGAASPKGMSQVALFWHGFAAKCVSALCHMAVPDVPPDASVLRLPFPGDPADWIDSAPPMPGGEYLNADNLRRIWDSILVWCAAQLAAYDDICKFLEDYAPGWGGIGRLYCHLGENRLNVEMPFAFLATVSAGLSDKGVPRHAPLAHALKKYAADGNRAAQIRILSQLDEAARIAPWLKPLLVSSDIGRPVPLTPGQAHRFLLSAPALEEAGIGIRLPDWWKKRPRVHVEAEVSARDPARMGAQALLDFNLRLALGEEAIDDAELDALLDQAADSLVLVKNQWVEIDRDKLLEALEHWRKVKADADAGRLTFSQGMRMLAGMDMTDDDVGREEAENIRQWSHVSAGAGFRELLRGAREEIDILNIPGFQGRLRPYQQQGVHWLRFLNRIGLGACLADDMGLGKTVQILALLMLERENVSAPALLVVPASLLASWKHEIERFAPSLRFLIFHSSEMSVKEIEAFNDLEELREYDLVITSYAMNMRIGWLADIEWSRVIADEAQNIKNSRTRQSVAVRKLKAPARIALTGTPIENSLGDLWTLFDFLNPGLLGSAKEFDSMRKRLMDSPEGLAPLRRLTAPYIMRRMKSDKNIISSLPEKTEMPLYCNLSKEQAKLYRQVVENMRKSLNELGSTAQERNKRNLVVLQSMTLLKQICNHPAQAGAGGAYSPERSGKFQCVGELCSEIAARQERVLLFTQFREIIPALFSFLERIFGSPGLTLHGGVPVKKRGELVREFQKEDGPPFFILSLKAGGTGLTLTEASHVIHFDRWWNPAVEDQATDRAYRIGQNRNVLVHKCLALGTLEEKIAGLIEGKRDLAAQVLAGLDSNITALSDSEIMDLVSLDARRALA